MARKVKVGASLKNLWRNWIRPILPVVIVLLAFRSAVADWNDVPTGSMNPTIVEGDRIFINKLAFDVRVPFTNLSLARTGEPQRGDIVIFYSPNDGTRMVKRVIGLSGDRIELRNNLLLVNGEPAMYEPLTQIAAGSWSETFDGRDHAIRFGPDPSSRSWFGPYIVPTDHVFVMGDNRDNSFDSRFFGPVPRDQIVGRAVGVVLSVDRDHGYAPRWSRFFQDLK